MSQDVPSANLAVVEGPALGAVERRGGHPAPLEAQAVGVAGWELVRARGAHVADSTRPGSGNTVAAPASGTRRSTAPRTDSAIIRGIYVNRWAAQSPKRMRSLIALADTTEINAFVIDIKDEFGLNYKSSDTLVARNAGNAGTSGNR